MNQPLSPSNSLRVDSLIAQRYKLTALIATGGMGQVWKSLDTRLDRKVAIKVLKSEYSNSQDFLRRFRIEAKTAAGLNNQNIAAVYDYGETDDEFTGSGLIAYLVMELIDGEPLSTILRGGKSLPVDRSLEIMQQTASGLQAAHHDGLVHRDIKPGNLLITHTNIVKITDFGIAKAADAATITRTGTVMGTAQYISPEQASGKEATPASDVYSLGILGYEVLSGQRPFNGDSPVGVALKHIQEDPPSLPQHIPDNVQRLIQYAMSKDPNERYRNGFEFAHAIQAVQEGKSAPLPQSMSAITTIQAQPAPLISMYPPLTRARPVKTELLVTPELENVKKTESARSFQKKNPVEAGSGTISSTRVIKKKHYYGIIILFIFMLLVIVAMVVSLFLGSKTTQRKITPQTTTHSPTKENSAPSTPTHRMAPTPTPTPTPTHRVAPKTTHTNPPPKTTHTNPPPKTTHTNPPPKTTHTNPPPKTTHTNPPPKTTHTNPPPKTTQTNPLPKTTTPFTVPSTTEPTMTQNQSPPEPTTEETTTFGNQN